MNWENFTIGEICSLFFPFFNVIKEISEKDNDHNFKQ